MPFAFPGPLYPIADEAGSHRALEVLQASIAAGLRLVQLRVKRGSTGAFVSLARAAKDLTDRAGVGLIINDRADIARLVDAAGVHLGTGDLPAAAARAILGPTKVIGLSTHNPDQLAAADREGCADYLAYGPIFATRSKERPDPTQGIEGLRIARGLTSRPLVAIGGITAATLRSVLETGTDAVAVIGAIAQAEDPVAAARTLSQEALAAATARRGRPRS